MKHHYPALWHQLPLLGFLWLTTALVAQPPADSLKCDYRLKVASEYLSDFGFASHVMVEEIKASVKNCDNNSTDADFVQGMLTRFFAENEEDKEMAFNRIEKAAIGNHGVAAKTLALMLKEGEGCLLNLESSVNWLRKAHKLGDKEAAYILGYYYMKGLGTIRQNYNKAIKWFQDSHHPMAKHWLALCQFYGFGTPQDKELALSNLMDNGISNSLYLYDHLTKYEIEKTSIDENHHLLIDKIAINDIKKQYVVVEGEGLGKPKETFLLVWDWSKEKIQQLIPVTLGFNMNDDSRTELNFISENHETTALATALGDQMGFDDFSIIIPNSFPDHQVEMNLYIDIFTAHFSQALIGNTPVVMGELEGWVANFNEPAPPLSILLIDPWDGLLQQERSSIQKDPHNIIANYPNQFSNDLVVSFSLENTEMVQASITHFNQLDDFELLPRTQLDQGEHILRKDTSTWPSGLYVIKVSAGTKVYHKLIIKKH